MNITKTIRWFFTLLGMLIGLLGGLQANELSLYVLNLELPPVYMAIVITIAALMGGALGFWLGPIAIKAGTFVGSWLEVWLQRTSLQDILSGAMGMIVGLIIGNLLGSALAPIPGIGNYLPTICSIAFTYLGVVVALRKKEDIAALMPSFPRPRLKRERGEKQSYPSQIKMIPKPKILDTSVIIDGRIADICKTGFLEGTLVIPSFVLEELRHIADSSDTLKRNRGRRGLEVLNIIQKEIDTPVEIYDKDFPINQDVDSKLVRLAKLLDGKVITNDFNLNRVAELLGVPVLNINELANALKPVVLPGEEMHVHVIKDGKESGQGVAYLDDGTMIVVDGGKKHIGETVGVLVTSVLQTAAGRMIFAKPKSGMEKAVP